METISVPIGHQQEMTYGESIGHVNKLKLIISKLFYYPQNTAWLGQGPWSLELLPWGFLQLS